MSTNDIEYPQKKKLSETESFWLEMLAGFSAPTPLAVDKTPSGALCEKPVFSEQQIYLPEPLTESLQNLADQNRLALADFVQLAWVLLLSRYSSEDDVIYGTCTNDYSGEESAKDQQCELFPLRIAIAPEDTVLSLAAHVHKQLGKLEQHTNCTLQQIQDWNAVPRSLPFFESAVIYQRETSDAPTVSGQAGNAAFSTDCPLILAVTPGPKLLIKILFDSRRFDDSTVQRMLGHLMTLLKNFTARPEQRVSSIPLLTDAEYHQLIVEWNDTAMDFPEDLCLHQLFESQVEQNPDAIAVIYGEQQLTYRELNERANQLAHYLQKKGVGPDVMVGICIERCLDVVVGLVGILKAGGAYVPMDPEYPKERLAFMFDDTRVPVLLTQNSLLDRLPAHSADTVCVDTDRTAISQESKENPGSGVTAGDLVYVIYTSGSTGKPKGVMLDHRGRVNNFCDFNRRFSVGPGDRLLALSSLGFDMSAYDVFGILATGGTAVVVEASAILSPSHWAELMSRHQITVWHSVPALLEMLVDYVCTRPELYPRALRLVLLGGDWIPVTLPDRLRAMVKTAQIISLGGATEVSMDSTIYEVLETDKDWKSIPYGVPMTNQLAYVLDRNLQPVPIGVPGELHLGGVGVSRGYLNSPQLTAEKFIPDPFRKDSDKCIYKTGDLARYRPDGNLELLGRSDFQVKIRGFRIEPGEIEATLRGHPAVRECVVLVPDEKERDKRLVAYVVQDQDYIETSEEAKEWQDAQVDEWQSVYDSAYSRSSEPADPTFNIVSWDSSYTGQPIADEQMREWVDYTVESICEMKPKRVLEIGCGTGLLLFRIAPECTEYLGTDISTVALDYVSPLLEKQGLSQVSLVQQKADDFTGIEPGSFDAVVLNSIVVDFPSIDYLMQVLQGAARAVAPGGMIFVGDVRNFQLLESFYASVQLHRATGGLTAEQIKQHIDKQLRMEEELVIDPAFFAALPEHIPEIGHVRIQHKRGSHHNELTKFRYDVTLSITTQDTTPANPDSWLDWQGEGLSIEGLEHLLQQDAPQCLAIKGVPNARLLADVCLVEMLASSNADETADSLRKALRQTLQNTSALDPELLWKLGEKYQYAVDIRYAVAGRQNYFDVILLRRDTRPESATEIQFPGIQAVDAGRAVRSYANNPLQAKASRKLTPALRAYLEERLPEYMIPSAFVLLDAFPLSPNGKVNRRALPAPDATRPAMEGEYVAPRTPIEAALSAIWSEFLGLDRVGIDDGFLALGGNSLLATQIASGMRDIFQLETPLSNIFKLKIRELALWLEQAGQAAQLDVTEIADIFIQVSEFSEQEVQTTLAETRESI